jgi:hypothetical protein
MGLLERTLETFDQGCMQQHAAFIIACLTATEDHYANMVVLSADACPPAATGHGSRSHALFGMLTCAEPV